MSATTGIIVTADLVYDTIGATPEEKIELETLNTIRSELMKELERSRNLHEKPSVIIENFLYLGDLWHACSIDVLVENEINAIVNVCDCQIADEVNNNVDVLWKPVDDALGIDIKRNFQEINEFIETYRKKGKKVLVNCQMGISRSSTVVLAYLMKHQGMTLFEAYDYLIRRRRAVNPNPGFLLQLVRYEKELENERRRIKPKIDQEKEKTGKEGDQSVETKSEKDLHEKFDTQQVDSTSSASSIQTNVPNTPLNRVPSQSDSATQQSTWKTEENE